MKGFDRIKDYGAGLRLNFGLLVWCFLATGLVFSGLEKWWTDSEMWSAVATGAFFDGKQEYFFGIKPLFHFVTWGNFQLSRLMEVHPMVTGRALWAVLALFVMVLCDQILKRNKVAIQGRLIFQLLLFGTSTWIFRASEVRSDLLASFIVLGLMAIPPTYGKKTKIALFAIFFAAAVLVTSKSVLLFLALSPILIHRIEGKRPSLKQVGTGVSFAALFFLFFSRTFLEGFHFLQKQIIDNSGIHLLSLARLEHILRMYGENPHVALVPLVSLGFVFWKSGTAGLKKRDVIALLLIHVILWSYPDPLPFFLASYLPFIFLLSILAGTQVDGGRAPLSKKVFVLLAGLLIGNSLYSVVRVLNHNNHVQRYVAEWAESELSPLEDALIYDPTGIIATSNAEHWFLGPAMGEQGYRAIFETISYRRPDVILFTDKLNYITPEILEFLDAHYFQWGTSVFIKLISFEPFAQKTCEDAEAEVRKTFPGVLASAKSGEITVLRVPQSGSSFVEKSPSIALACSASRNQSDRELYLFAVAPPRSPVEDFTRLFNYDFYF